MNPISDGTKSDVAVAGVGPPANAPTMPRSATDATDADEGTESNETQALVLVLNGLIEVASDGARMFTLATSDALDPDYKALFAQHSHERTQFMRELQIAVRSLGGNPQDRGTLEGALLRAWMDVKAAVAVREDYAVLREVERAEQNARKRYARALTLDLGGDVKALVERQYSAVSRSHDRMRALRQKHALRS